jgi:hypothetical protein
MSGKRFYSGNFSVQDIDREEKSLNEALSSGKINKTQYESRQAELVGLAETAGGAVNAPKQIKEKFQKAVAEKGLERKFAEDMEAPKEGVSNANKAKIAEAGLKMMGVGSAEGGSTSGSESALTGAASGASMAASMGLVDPVSMGTAAVIGGAMGALGARANRKAAEKAADARAQAEHAANLGRIEQEKDQKIQGALNSMRNAFSKNLTNVGPQRIKF